MTVVTTLDVHGMSREEYRAVMDKLAVERRPEAGIYLQCNHHDGFRLSRRGDLGSQGGIRGFA